ncbi:nitroreductase family protein [Gordonia sp. HY285]|uniref:nitroreductase family protein n=1 Tax=Gordonia liuliyuniae TaxID=2911517 RepID=UPI001F282FCA|nr:nitroreductase family protein [Gordonia liuliyuniae]MCF8610590.1 nitroreductase family protein [Gordonia liuliyuniae]
MSADTAAADHAFADQGKDRGTRFCWIETGLIAQNVYLWAAETGFGTVLLGGVDDDAIAAAPAPWPPHRGSRRGTSSPRSCRSAQFRTESSRECCPGRVGRGPRSAAHDRGRMTCRRQPNQHR